MCWMIRGAECPAKMMHNHRKPGLILLSPVTACKSPVTHERERSTRGGSSAAAKTAKGGICWELRAVFVGEQKRFSVPRTCRVSHMRRQFALGLLRGERSCWKAFSPACWGGSGKALLVRAGSQPRCEWRQSGVPGSLHMPAWRMGTGKGQKCNICFIKKIKQRSAPVHECFTALEFPSSTSF